MSEPETLRHIGSHIFKDICLKDANELCGLCLNTGGLCSVYLIKCAKDVWAIDMKHLWCQNLKAFNIKTALEFKTNSPCTNHPLLCPLCPTNAPAIWKYNLQKHISQSHYGATVHLYKNLFELDPAEHTLMKRLFNNKPCAKKSKGN